MKSSNRSDEATCECCLSRERELKWQRALLEAYKMAHDDLICEVNDLRYRLINLEYFTKVI